MGKFTTIFYTFVAAVLILFVTFVYLMTTVNPGRLPNDVHAHGATVVVRMATTTETNRKRTGLMKLLDYNEGEGPTSDDPKTMNITDQKKPKGRRSIKQCRKKKPGVVIMKIVDSDGRPIIEIVFYPKNNDWKRYKKHNGSKRPKTDLLRNSILNIMPDDSIIFENKYISFKHDLEYTIPGDTADKTELTTEAFDVKNLGSNLTKPSDHNEIFTELNTVLSPEPEREKIQTESYTKVLLVEKADDLLDSTGPMFNNVNWNMADIGLNKTETDLGLNLIKTSNSNKGGTDQYTVLLSPAQDTSETTSINVTTEMKMDYSEELHPTSSQHEDVSTKNIDNSSPNLNTSNWNKDIEMNENESKDVFDTEDHGTILITTSNPDSESGTKPNILMSEPDTSLIEGSRASVTVEMAVE